MKHLNKNILYNIMIIISTIDLVAGIAFATLCLWGLLDGVNKTGATFQYTNVAVQQTQFVIPPFIWGLLSVICFILYAPLTIYRQKLRDEVEYDENGINRKRGKFSQLSRKEREAIEQQKMMDAERLLDSPTVKKITHKGYEDPENAMCELIGLSTIKEQIETITARIQYEQNNFKEEKRTGKRKRKEKFTPLSGLNMIFMGPPGTGKTTVARIMTGILYNTGYIKENKCIEIDGNFFRCRTPGETSQKTKMVIQKAYNGVLFIDEAYAILAAGGGQETIATIVKEMEDNKDKIVFIFAGYEKEMKDFINSNPGIESRIKHYMYFGDYSTEDMQQIFISMANKENLCVTAELLDCVISKLLYLKQQKNFGNARTIRNLLDQIIDRHAMNLSRGIISEDCRYKLLPCDMPPKEKHNHNL